MYINVCMHIPTHTHMYTHKYVYIYIYVCIHIHTYIHTDRQADNSYIMVGSLNLVLSSQDASCASAACLAEENTSMTMGKRGDLGSPLRGSIGFYNRGPLKGFPKG